MTMMPMPRRRPGLGISLEDIMGTTPKPDFGAMTPGMGMDEPPKKQGFLAPGSKGQIIAGIIGDTLASLSGGSPMFTQTLLAQRQRDQDMQAQDAQWTRRRAAEREDRQWEWSNKPKDDAIPPILRDAQAWQNMTPEQRTAYQQMQDAQRGPITVLPNGQAFIRDPAIAQQLGVGGGQPRPVGKLTPIDGGPTPPASGPFRR